MNRINEPGSFRARITDWPVDERPREKLMSAGSEAVSNAELIAILLGQGTRQLNAVELARKLLYVFGSLEALSNASIKELQKVEGIGPAKAVTLLAAFQLYRRLQKEKAEREIRLFDNPARVAEVYQPIIGHLKNEVFYVVLLNTRLQRINDFCISMGTLDASIVHPREVFRPAIRHSAKGILVLHNHPSGNLIPSHSDEEITHRLIEAGKLLDIPVYDHIILNETGYYSFKEHGLLFP